MKKDKEIMVLVQSGCGGCEALRKSHPEIKYLDVDKSRKGKRIADRLGVEYVPAVVQVDRKTGDICVLDEDLNVVKCIPKGKR